MWTSETTYFSVASGDIAKVQIKCIQQQHQHPGRAIHDVHLRCANASKNMLPQ